MGYPDFGGGPRDPAHGAHAARLAGPPPEPGAVPVTELTGPQSGPADLDVTLVARQETITLATGETVDGFTLNHRSPGPLIRVRQGDLMQVTLFNESVPDGVTLHWHGVDLPNGEDGVAGVTQDATPPGLARPGTRRPVRGPGRRPGRASRRDRRRRTRPHVSRTAHGRRCHRHQPGDGCTRRSGPGPSGEHRQRTDRPPGRRNAVPSACGRRTRDQRPDISH
ncbi:MAG: multicopper oxidase domain-containing protein [Jiangellaceae bacterium]